MRLLIIPNDPIAPGSKCEFVLQELLKFEDPTAA